MILYRLLRSTVRRSHPASVARIAVAAAVLAVAALRASADDKPAFEPISAYTPQTVEGFPLLVNQRLLAAPSGLAERTLAIARVKLFEINRVVPPAALADLQKVQIWLELDDNRKDPCCCYHPDALWLKANGFNPEKVKCVEVCSAATFCDWSRAQPWMLLHELAHAYHDRKLGFENPQVEAAYQAALAGKKYESVLRYNGRHERHYALRNAKEYFAEATESYFGANDYYPFVQAELREIDPGAVRLLEEVWQVSKKPAAPK